DPLRDQRRADPARGFFPVPRAHGAGRRAAVFGDAGVGGPPLGARAAPTHRRADADRLGRSRRLHARVAVGGDAPAHPRLGAVRRRGRLAHRAHRAPGGGHRAHRRVLAQAPLAVPRSGTRLFWRSMSINAHRAIRIISLLVFAGACGLAWHKLRRTPEQEDLTRYVEVEVPRVTASEQPIQERIDRLGQAPGLKPDEARTLLIDDVIPRLIRLRKQAEELATDKRTREVRAL